MKIYIVEWQDNYDKTWIADSYYMKESDARSASVILEQELKYNKTRVREIKVNE